MRCVRRTRCLIFILAAALSQSCTSDYRERSGSPKFEARAWNSFVNAEHSTPFIDYSNAGAFYSERSIPQLTLKVFPVSDYGAKPDDQQDDTLAIQAAINAAQENGRGTVTFKPGVYHLNGKPENGPIRITGSDIVLRGSGDGQTTLLMTKPMPPARPSQKWSGPAMIIFAPDDESVPNSEPYSKHDYSTLNAPAKSGDTVVFVQEQHHLSAGDTIVFEMESTAANQRFLNNKTARKVWTRLNERGVMAREIHEVQAVDENRIILKKPLITSMDADLPWKVIRSEFIQQVGFENLCVKTTFNEPFVHHKNAMHDSGFRAVELRRTSHSWVVNNCFVGVSTAVSVKGGVANTVKLNTIEGHSGHFGFDNQFSTRSLFAMNADVTTHGQYHGPNASHLSVGTVFWNFLNKHGGGFDLHGTYPRHTLIDNFDSAGFSNWGGNYRHLPNHLEGLVIWNFRHRTKRVGSHYNGELNFWQLPSNDSQKYGFLTAVNPTIVGYQGPIQEVNESNVALTESIGSSVTPSSLYAAQLEKRLGYVPSWVTTDLQKWRELRRQHVQ